MCSSWRLFAKMQREGVKSLSQEPPPKKASYYMLLTEVLLRDVLIISTLGSTKLRARLLRSTHIPDCVAIEFSGANSVDHRGVSSSEVPTSGGAIYF